MVDTKCQLFQGTYAQITKLKDDCIQKMKSRQFLQPHLQTKTAQLLECTDT